NELYKEKKCKFNFDIEVFDGLIYTRNKNWFIKIQETLESNKSIFIAVGLAHLDFKTGLISMLQEKGYIVTPINL
ncbi:TraB/GumN family protein, partial [Flavobacterium sp.]|uniref:TraB/GumN family protein n=1 Tax=Flavobacterium sp. TaxID=239 RepID=UPI0039192C1A